MNLCSYSQDIDQLLIGTIYRSTNNSAENHNLLQSIINKTTERKPSHFLLMGDFNYPDINWRLGTSPPDMRNSATRFLETLCDAYLHQHVMLLTLYRGTQNPNILDLIIKNEEGMISYMVLSAPIGKVILCV